MIISDFIKERLRIPALRLQGDAGSCANCGSCDRNCSMSLPVRDMVKSGEMFHQECILCGVCADSCSKNAIRMHMGMKQHKVPAVVVTQKPQSLKGK
jgi:Pyruvate/2-oxoacid:ferredoxin oxidoreductase delta subunit